MPSKPGTKEMAGITDPIVTVYNEKQHRPLSESVRDLCLELNDAIQDYHTNVATSTDWQQAATTDDIVGNREDEGIANVTKGDLENSITLWQQICDLLDGTDLTRPATPGVEQVYLKPCVRPVRLSD